MTIFVTLQVETLKEQIWELDSTNRNNLVFYDMKEDGVTPEFAVKEVIRRSHFPRLRFHLYFHPIRKIGIIRDVPILKAKRAEGSNVRGTRPITVCFEKFHVNFESHPPSPLL